MIPIAQQVSALAADWCAWKTSSPAAAHDAAMRRRTIRALEQPRCALQKSVHKILRDIAGQQWNSETMLAALHEHGIDADRRRVSQALRRLAAAGAAERLAMPGSPTYVVKEPQP